MTTHQNLNVVVFAGVQNLPLFAALEQGLFAKRGLAVNLTFTPNSWTLRDGLANGTFDIAHTAVDNAVAMVEIAHEDVAIVIGGDNGFNGLFTQPGIAGLSDLRGRTVLVDAPDTAFALVMYEILKRAGLGRDDYAVKSIGATPFRLEELRRDPAAAASILNLPFRVQAEQAGFLKIGEAVDLVGPYLSTAGFVMRPWAAANSDILVRYIQAYVEGLRWVLQPAHAQGAIALLMRHLELSEDVAARSFAIASAPGTGLTPDAKFDLAGFANVLRLRAESPIHPTNVRPVESYLDPSFYEKALAGL